MLKLVLAPSGVCVGFLSVALFHALVNLNACLMARRVALLRTHTGAYNLLYYARNTLMQRIAFALAGGTNHGMHLKTYFWAGIPSFAIFNAALFERYYMKTGFL